MEFYICTVDCSIEHFQMWIIIFFKEFFILVENCEEFILFQTTGDCAKYLCCQILMEISVLTNCYNRLLVRGVGLHQNVFVYPIALICCEKIIC